MMLFLLQIAACGQDSILNKYGLWVINDVATYQKNIEPNKEKEMADVKKHIPSIKIDIKYATTNNFMHTALYPPIKTTYLRYAAVNALIKVQAYLKKQNLGLKIWDAYRPYRITEKMWEPVKDSRYTADPRYGSGHNRGIAVDLTLIHLKNGKELDMGTGFDNFSDTAHPYFKNLTSIVLHNRLILQTAMEKYGFKILETEWWHFYLPETKKYELLNIDFETMKRLSK